MKNPKHLQSQLLQLPLIQKLKSTRGTGILRKLVNLLQKLQFPTNDTIYNNEQQTYLLIIYEGKIQLSKQLKCNSNKQLQYEIVHKFNHCIIDKSVVKVQIQENTVLYKLKQKYILQIFQGIINLPFLSNRLKQLRNIQLFSNMERRKLVKIAFDLQQITLNIGSKVQTQILCPYTQIINKFCYYIISGELKVVHKGIALCILGANQIFGIIHNQYDHQNNEHNQHIKIIQDSVGYIITQRATLYKIPINLILNANNNNFNNFTNNLIQSSVNNSLSINTNHNINLHAHSHINASLHFPTSNNKNINQYINKRIKWRENRLLKIDTVKQYERQLRKKNNKQKLSFIEKESKINSLYGDKRQQHKKYKECYKVQYIKCENREQFYGKKLDKIKQLQQKRYGVMNQTVVLFPIPLNKTMKNLVKTLGVQEIFEIQIETPSRKKRRFSTQPSKTVSSVAKPKKFFSFAANNY